MSSSPYLGRRQPQHDCLLTKEHMGRTSCISRAFLIRAARTRERMRGSSVRRDLQRTLGDKPAILRKLAILSLVVATMVSASASAASATSISRAVHSRANRGAVEIPAHSAAGPRSRPFTDGPATTTPSADNGLVMAQSAAGQTIPLWTGKVRSQGSVYTYRMVGKSPFVYQSNPTVTIDVPIISAVLHFSDGTESDPTKPTGCGPSISLSPKQLVAGSPIFKNSSYVVGGTFVGSGQYVSEFQRANFWRAIRAARDPDYAVQLRPRWIDVQFSPSQLAPFNPITDPSGPLPCGHSWGLDAFALDRYIQQVLIPSLHIGPTSFPIFLGSNICGYVGSPLFCSVGGSHGDYLNTHGLLQTYAEVDFDTTGFEFSPDVSILAHEIGEWMDDPLNNNVTPLIPGIACQSTPPAPANSVEVGDPLEGHNETVGPMRNGVTYHPQELAFLSWFYDQVPSRAANPRLYSSGGTFQQDAANTQVCF